MGRESVIPHNERYAAAHEYMDLVYSSVKACFLNLPVLTIVHQTPCLIDCRFFFQSEDGTGGYSRGVVRKAVAEALVANYA